MIVIDPDIEISTQMQVEFGICSVSRMTRVKQKLFSRP